VGFALFAPGFACAPAFGGDFAFLPAFGRDLVADLRGLLARDARLALGFALLAVIIRPFFVRGFSVQGHKCSAPSRGSHGFA
jgi:hypothetical protein